MEKKKKKFKCEVEAARCKACGYCRCECPNEVFEQSDQTNPEGYRYMVAAHNDKCVGCLTCLMVCPDFAITVSEVA
jgi:NAD-dependent dihydropyrimidine dehydrogenase PreA subunit